MDDSMPIFFSCDIFNDTVSEFGKDIFFYLFFMGKLLTLSLIYKKKKWLVSFVISDSKALVYQ